MTHLKVKNVKTNEEEILDANGLFYAVGHDPATEDFKHSAREFLDRADAVIIHEHEHPAFSWRGVSLKPVFGRPVFYIHPPDYVTPQIINFIETRLQALTSATHLP